MSKQLVFRFTHQGVKGKINGQRQYVRKAAACRHRFALLHRVVSVDVCVKKRNSDIFLVCVSPKAEETVCTKADRTDPGGRNTHRNTHCSVAPIHNY